MPAYVRYPGALRSCLDAPLLVAIDPDRAERIAYSLTDESDQGRVLVGVAAALAATNPDRAERIAQSITDKTQRAHALAKIANV